MSSHAERLAEAHRTGPLRPEDTALELIGDAGEELVLLGEPVSDMLHGADELDDGAGMIYPGPNR